MENLKKFFGLPCTRKIVSLPLHPLLKPRLFIQHEKAF